MNPGCFIKFKNGDLAKLRAALLRDLSKESFAVLIGKHERASGVDFINVFEIFLTPSDKYDVQSQAFLRLKKEFIHKVLVEVTTRADVDCIVDVHTHPFAKNAVSFSPVDDQDEMNFSEFIASHFDVHYASIVFSQQGYSARIWEPVPKISCRPALIKTQTALEQIEPSEKKSLKDGIILKQDSFFNRSVLALGIDSMRRIANNQTVSIAGVGGLGSIIAEHLVHMGFQNINLFDNDRLELSNMNRFVGASYEDALNGAWKVEVVKNHLTKINPDAKVSAYTMDVEDPKFEEPIALSDWIFIATDNHYSRYRIQELAFKYFVPFISAGVNISVKDDRVTDISGEVITVRAGDNFCLNCLGRINFIKIANEKHPVKEIRDELVNKGYVEGLQVKEPAVKTLNAMLATMAVDALVDQYTGLHKHRPILVYENNSQVCIYEDVESIENRPSNCAVCSF